MEREEEGTVRVIEQSYWGDIINKKKASPVWMIFLCFKPRRGTPRNSWWGCAVLQTLTLFQTIKHVIFHTHFETRDPFLESPDNKRARSSLENNA